MKKLISYIFSIVFILLVSLFYYSYNTSNSSSNKDVKLDYVINVHFIDVGQGDATFIELPNNECMLIDAGERSYGDVVKNYIEKLGYSSIDYVIGTHPHTDHIGGLENIINSFGIGSIYMPMVTSNSKTFESLINTISSKDLKINSARDDVVLFDYNNLKGYFVAPVSSNYSDLNNYSAVLLLRYGNVSFLFMGDAEILSENEINDNIDVDVVKIGHHGSISSSGSSLINRVSARYGIISVGKNSYGHPSDEVISRWSDNGTYIYRTDINGDIVVNTDGNEISISVER